MKLIDWGPAPRYNMTCIECEQLRDARWFYDSERKQWYKGLMCQCSSRPQELYPYNAQGEPEDGKVVYAHPRP